MFRKKNLSFEKFIQKQKSIILINFSKVNCATTLTDHFATEHQAQYPFVVAQEDLEVHHVIEFFNATQRHASMVEHV